MPIIDGYWPDHDVVITTGYTLFSGGMSEYVTDAGVVIDSLAIKDGGFPGQPDFSFAGQPFLVQNSTMVDNLNAQKLGGYEAEDFSLASHDHDGSYYTETELDAGQLDNSY